jgi:hypothetical protein
MARLPGAQGYAGAAGASHGPQLGGVRHRKIPWLVLSVILKALK